MEYRRHEQPGCGGCFLLLLLLLFITGGAPRLFDFLGILVFIGLFLLLSGVAAFWAFSYYIKRQISTYEKSQTETHNTFVFLLVNILVKIAQIDGKVTSDEINTIHRFFQHNLHYTQNQLYWVKELVKEALGSTVSLENLLQDSRYALRQLRGNPGFTLVAVLTLGLGIGATTVIFSFVNAILLSPLPYQNPDRLVRINTMWFGQRGTSLSEPEYHSLRTEARTLEAVVATSSASQTLLLDTPRRITTLQATHELFPVLGVPPLIGRVFTKEEELPGASPVALLSHALWTEMCHGRRPG